ncbi:hypothetical protein A3L09_06210 [Thermococcus profundus]|uniref:4-vinyl reductase 4VR domain-containing protein n=1 Tax=Thermococcus profundus TaxID=49899 RepID=A0A2Z2MG69_THEPR|nr:hypothetical protein A3L09_06210 [Thermococcus profundus]
MERLDEALGGGFKRGLNVAIVGSFEEDNLLFMHQIAYALLKQGLRVLVAEFRQDPAILRDWLSYYGIDYGEYLEKGQAKILDGFTNLYAPQSKSGKDVIPNPRDLGITVGIIRNELSTGDYDVLIIDDLTVLYSLQADRDAYTRIIIRLVNSIKGLNEQVFAGVNSEVLEKGDLAKLLLGFEYVLEVKEGKIKILRSPYPVGLPTKYLPYKKTERGIEDLWESYYTLKDIKENLTLDEEGNLWSGSSRVQIISEESEASLVEFVYQYLGPGEGKKFLYLWGRYEFRGAGATYRNIHATLRETLERFIKGTEASGGGKLDIVQISDDIIILRGKNLFPRLRSFQYPAHVNYAGEIAQFLEEYTGDPWEGEEVHCQAQGYEYCEFVFKRKSGEREA